MKFVVYRDIFITLHGCNQCPSSVEREACRNWQKAIIELEMIMLVGMAEMSCWLTRIC